MKKTLIVLVAVAVAFAAGYIPQYLSNQQLASQLGQSEEEMQGRIVELEGRNRLLALHSQLGMLLLEVENQNYGTARERSTNWFDQLRDAAAGSTDASTNQALNAIMNQRDTLTSLLTEADPKATATVREMYVSLAAALGVR